MNLAQFVAKKGSQEAAASEIGVSFTTLNRWINGHHQPKGLYRQRLIQLRISPDWEISPHAPPK